MTWFKKSRDQKIDKKVKIPEGMWVKCENCKEIIYKREVERNLKVCPKCDYHFRISARERLELMVDDGSFTETNADIISGDPLQFKDTVPYKERINESIRNSNLNDAIITGTAMIKGYPVIIGIMDFSFFGGAWDL